jgi:DnaJ-class molecular chaperone
MLINDKRIKEIESLLAIETLRCDICKGMKIVLVNETGNTNKWVTCANCNGKGRTGIDFEKLHDTAEQLLKALQEERAARIKLENPRGKTVKINGWWWGT